MDACDKCRNGIIMMPEREYNGLLLRHSDCRRDATTSIFSRHEDACAINNSFVKSAKVGGTGPILLKSSTLRILHSLLIWTLILQFLHSLPEVDARTRKSLEYHWKTGPWKPCESKSCGAGGVQLRSVRCMSNREWRGLHSFCDETKKPADERPCFKICEEHRHMYTWQAADWEECSFVRQVPVANDADDKCGLGIAQIGSQRKNISCVNVENPTLIVDNYVCENFNPPPSREQPCEVPCPINCATSHWGEWSKCSKTCGNGTQHRTRGVITREKYGGEECPELSSTRPCIKQTPCDPLLVTFFANTLKFGNWTSCVPGKFELAPTSSSNRRKHRKEMRRKLAAVKSTLVGGRERHITCFNGDGDPLGQSISVKETCTVSMNCEVTEWSEWSICAAVCGRDGSRFRTREVTTPPAGPNGEECPKLEEEEECEVDANMAKKCNEYTWVTGGWDGCQTIDNATCGGGIQERDVYCAVRDAFTNFMASMAAARVGDEGPKEWAKMRPVADEYCDLKYKPKIWRECDVVCSSMCEVGEWSDWSECAPERCVGDPKGIYYPEHLRNSRKSQKTGFKRRTREILDSLSGKDGCPHTTEVIPCEDPRCFRWYSVSVSPCVASGRRCGNGTQQQSIVCRDPRGNDVDSELCRRRPAAPRLETSLPCYVPCSSDCVTSEWGSWTPCTNDCKRGKRESGEQKRFREILANPGPGGRGCPPSSELEETRSCNQHRCSIYYWDVGPWSDCLVKSNVTSTPPAFIMRASDMFMSDDGNSSQPLYFPPVNQEQVCGKGYQIRLVKCRKKDSGLVQDKLCGSKRSKPLITRDCTFPCPKDCVLSQWGEWTDCEKECDKVARPGHGVLEPIYQERHRVVVQHRTGRGTPCPLERKQRRPCMSIEKCMLFRWKSSRWSSCVRIAGATSIYFDESSNRETKCLGLKTRTVQCRHYSSNVESKAVAARLCFKYADHSAPERTKHCLIQCKPNRNFKNWMRNNSCSATVHNFESYEEIYAVQPETENSLSHITMQKTAKPVGNWSSCNITKSEPLAHASLLNKKISEPYCGVGTRQRALSCYIEGTDIQVDSSHCQYREFQLENCEIPCPMDCQMSPWTSWGKCGDSTVDRIGSTTSAPVELPCGENIRMRHRYQTEEQEHGGRLCPAVDSLSRQYETELCQTVCESLFWVPMAWRKCVINRNGEYSNCGAGFQTRSPECYGSDRASGHPNVARVVDDMRKCGMNIMPLGSRNCTSPCLGECVYSEWSLWQKCESTNQREDSCSGIRKRTRRVLRKIAPETGIPDSHCDNERKTVQRQQCELNNNCFTYSAMWTDWSSCILPPDAGCGTGVSRRRSNCVSSMGLPVHKSKCIENGVTIPPPEHESCHVICPIDCELSKWSEWSRCAGACDDVRERKRTREVIREPSVLGRPCSSLEETTPCPVKPCHEWSLGDWSECKVSGGNCGTGLRMRDVKCLQDDGLMVSSSLCRSLQGDVDRWFGDSELRQDCQITCAGECHMTEWTDWSACHLHCINATTPVSGVTAGVQTRSRVGFKVGQISEGDCPQHEIEEKSCPLEEAKCYFYKWTTTATFHRGKRPVWCQRTIDGLNVSTGCDDRLKMREEIYCIQDCDSIANAFCGDRSICECDPGYKPMTLTSGRLLSCLQPRPNDEADTVKVVDTEHDGEGRKVYKIPVETVPARTTTTPQEITRFESTTQARVKTSGFLEDLGLLTENGELKAWVYGAIAGIIIFIIFVIASICLICVTCRRKKSKPEQYGLYSTKNIKSSKLNKKRHKRRHGSSGSNVGVGFVIGMGPPRFPPSNSAMSHTSSTSRSGGYSYRDHDDMLWKDT